ncbi:MAG TPA: heme exporter protein CcmB [Fimbriimonas sp.]|nr:heme exporter protein CcmB [Fimbriimonas sp.]
MSSTSETRVWRDEVLAIFKKEVLSEFRGKTGLSTGVVFSLSTIVTVALALFNKNPNKMDLQDVCASLVWIILLFASLLTLPRSFLVEEEQGTGDLLRLLARPHAVFWGKVIFNLIQMWLLCLLVAVLFIGLTGIVVTEPLVLAACLFSGGASLVGAVTLCGAIASRAANRAALAGAISIPLVLFPTQWGVSGLREAFGSVVATGGNTAAIGLTAYALLSLGIGPWIYAAVWKQ